MTEGKRTTRLDELLSDPMIQLVMKSDRVEADDVRELFDRVADQYLVPAPHVIDSMCCGSRGLCA